MCHFPVDLMTPGWVGGVLFQTHSGVLTPGSAPAYRWTVGWLRRTGCSSLLYTPCCIRSLKCWAPGSCDHSSTRLQTPGLRTCNLWREKREIKIIVGEGREESSTDYSQPSLCFLILDMSVNFIILSTWKRCNQKLEPPH